MDRINCSIINKHLAVLFGISQICVKILSLPPLAMWLENVT